MKEYTVQVYPNGTKIWYLNGLRHREDGPAVERFDGENYWYFNGYLHREDGPAVEFSDGKIQWWLNGVQYSEEEYKLKMNPVKELTVEEVSNLLGYEVKVVRG